MNHKLPFRSLGALVVVFSLTGCAQWNYQDTERPLTGCMAETTRGR